VFGKSKKHFLSLQLFPNHMPYKCLFPSTR
jgi:hypothetical protein